ncbi:SH3 domain-containing protein 19 [Topomyia yanbarensis]|uniref:SH3 domain-containing protein 19 n=1 Tax=Topomyia yanbarensis TaxID=2498891 RepID=UPI00273C64E2|nr:SH3 domain-containing protein 19 [Topomyia yanbarensis]
MCDILSAMSYGRYPHQQRPNKRIKINMTIPSRPAPPPPQVSSNKINRYSPATSWDDMPFNPQRGGVPMANRQPPLSGAQPNQKAKKAPPPRPPPPKVVPALKKPGQPQSINILSNLFGQKRNHSGPKPPIAPKCQIPVKLPPPPKLPPPLGQHAPNYGSVASTPSSGHGSTYGTDLQLISFDSPPSSPTFTQKSCSDCISVDSFSSDSNYSSPNNGSMSQTESGFEDDFVNQNENQRSKTTTPASMAATKDPWDLSDPFGMPPPVTRATSSNHNIYAPLSSATIRAPAVNSKLYESEFVDPLCNGKTVLSKVQTVAMPTIIKNSAVGSSSSQKFSPALKPKPTVAPVQPVWAIIKPPVPLPTVASAFQQQNSTSFDDGEESLDSLPSLPMPNIPPPPPPPCVEVADAEEVTCTANVGRQEPYGIAMYDFNGETDEDLNFRTNDKIYLLKRLNEEWLLGRNRKGCEGMFPANYIEVRVPLPGERLAVSPSGSSSSAATNHGDISPISATNSFKHPQVRVLYTFSAEMPEDLTIIENEYVTVMYQLNQEWLYGERHGQRGQFPANFVEYVPPNLPPMPASGT